MKVGSQDFMLKKDAFLFPFLMIFRHVPMGSGAVQVYYEPWAHVLNLLCGKDVTEFHYVAVTELCQQCHFTHCAAG